MIRSLPRRSLRVAFLCFGCLPIFARAAPEATCRAYAERAVRQYEEAGSSVWTGRFRSGATTFATTTTGV